MSTIEVKVPDIGDFKDVPVIEVFVKPGDTVAAEDSLVTLESDKATMDVPVAGRGHGQGSEGQGRRQGDRRHVILTLEAAAAATKPAARRSASRRCLAAPQRQHLLAAPDGDARRSTAGTRRAPAAPAQPPRRPSTATAFKAAHASPSVRKFARELGVDLARVTGTGPKAASCRRTCRISSRQALSGAAAARRRRHWWRRAQPAAVAEGRFREVRPDRTEAAVAHQEDLRREPRAQLGDDSARHAVRRGRHHRARSIPRRAQQGEREGRHQGDDARVPDQGERRRAEEIPGFQRFVDRRRQSDPQAVLPHRLRRRHAERSRRAR